MNEIALSFEQGDNENRAAEAANSQHFDKTKDFLDGLERNKETDLNRYRECQRQLIQGYGRKIVCSLALTVLEENNNDRNLFEKLANDKNELRSFVFQSIYDELLVASQMADDYGQVHQLEILKKRVSKFLEELHEQ